MQITIDIPDELVQAGEDAAQRLLEDSVAQAYREKRIGTRQLREMLELSWQEKEEFLLRYGICYEVTAEEILADAERSRQARERHHAAVAAA